MNLKNSIEISKEEIIGKIIKVFIIFFFVIVFFNRCGSVVYADSINSSDCTFEFFDESDESLGGICYQKDEVEEEDVISTFSFNTKRISLFENEDEIDPDDYMENLRNSNFLDYPYWVMYLDTVYASDYPFVFGDDTGETLYAYDFDNEINMPYYSYKLGVSAGAYNVEYLEIPINKHYLVRSNHDIVYLTLDFDDLERVDTYEVPSYNVSQYPYRMKFGYYTIISKVPLVLYSDPDMQNIQGLYVSKGKESNGWPLPRFDLLYSYLGSDFMEATKDVRLDTSGTIRYGFKFEESYPSDSNFLSFLGVLNYDLYYGNVNVEDTDPIYYDLFFDISNPPEEWESFDSGYVHLPGYDGGNGDGGDEGGYDGGNGDGGDEGGYDDGNGDGGDEGGSILDYINPFSNKFFLKIAFVPSDDFFPNQVRNLISSNKRLVHNFDNIISSLETIFSTEFGTESFEGINYGNKILRVGTRIVYAPGCGSPPPVACKNPIRVDGGLSGVEYECAVFSFDLSNFKLLDASYISAFISKFRYYMNGVMDLFFVLWLVRWLLSLFGYHAPEGGYKVNGNKSNK